MAEASHGVYDTSAGELYHQFGRRPVDQAVIQLSTLLLFNKNDVQSIAFNQADSFDCNKNGDCLRDENSRHLWILVRFKDNSVARIELLNVERKRIDYLYRHSSVETMVTARVIIHGPEKDPILVRTYASNRPRRPTIQDPVLLAKVLGFYPVRVYSGQTKRLSRENHTMVTTAIAARSATQ